MYVNDANTRECIQWAHSENTATSKKTRKIINISLIATQIIGAALIGALFLSASLLGGGTQFLATHETLSTCLALSGSILFVGGSAFWAILGYHEKPAGLKTGIYVLTAIAIVAITIGAIAYKGWIPGIDTFSARCILGAGVLLSLPLMFPCLVSLMKCCKLQVYNPINQVDKDIVAFTHRLQRARADRARQAPNTSHYAH